jgi:hypothetical protein
VQSNAH